MTWFLYAVSASPSLIRCALRSRRQFVMFILRSSPIVARTLVGMSRSWINDRLGHSLASWDRRQISAAFSTGFATSVEATRGAGSITGGGGIAGGVNIIDCGVGGALLVVVDVS